MLGIKKQRKFAVHYREKHAHLRISNKLKKSLPCEQEIVFLCIGTDRVLLDIFGPLVGSFLKETGVKNVLGVLGQPVHAKNLAETVATIPEENFVVAIDAMSGAEENLGKIRIKNGKCYPGTGINKRLVPVGDVAISLNVVVEKGSRLDLFVSSEMVWCGAMLVANVLVDIMYKIEKFHQPRALSSQILPQGYWQVLFNQVR